MRGWLAVPLALTGCQFLAGLQGQRELGVGPEGGSGASAAMSGAASSPEGGSSSGVMVNAGAPPLAGDGAAGPTGSESGGASGGEMGAAGQQPTGGAGPIEHYDALELATPSCADLVPIGCADVDPCLTIPLPGGKFMMGRDEAGARADYFSTGSVDETPEHEVQLSPYLLDKYEVTVGRFRRFVEAYRGEPPEAAQGAHPNIFGSGWDSDWNQLLPVDQAALRSRLRQADETDNQNLSTWSEEPGDGECRPMNMVSWHVAFAFCVWDGGRLPTEAEWELAASGGDQERFFPWGKASPDGRAVFGCAFLGSLSCTAGDLPRVGSVSPAGDGRFGHADLAGSLAEFTRDAYDPAFYAGYQVSNADPINLGFYGSDPPVVLRGGSAVVAGEALRAAARADVPISTRSVFHGFRCARNP